MKIFLTEEGRKKAAVLKEIGAEVDACAMAHLSAAEQKNLVALLGKVRAAFEEV